MDETDELQCDFEVTEEFLFELKKEFEVDILKGERQDMPDGRINLKFSLTGEKAHRMRMFFHYLVSTQSGETKIKYFGQNINPN